MRSLLWCEWRSKRLWLLALAASAIVPILLGDPLSFFGNYASANSMEGWFYFSDALLPCMIIGLLFGLMAFSGELGSGLPDFLLSRPVSWKKLLAAKLLVGFGMIVGTALLALIVFRLICPAQYLPFLTVSRIGGGLIGAITAMAAPYLLGMACSVALPGAVGSVLMLLIVSVTAFLESLGIPQLRAVSERAAWVVLTPWLVALPLATLVIVRFGLTLSVAQRIRRYALVALTGVACVNAVTLSLYTIKGTTETLYYYNFSPDLSHAVVQETKAIYAPNGEVKSGEMHAYFWRLSDGLTRDVSLFTFDVEVMQWLDNDTAFCWRYGDIYHTSMTTVDLDKSGDPQINDYSFGYHTRIRVRDYISPDAKTAVLATFFKDSRGDDHRELRFWDFKTGRFLPLKVKDGLYFNGGWWQSNTEYAWLDEHDKRHVVRVR